MLNKYILEMFDLKMDFQSRRPITTYPLQIVIILTDTCDLFVKVAILLILGKINQNFINDP